MELSFRQSHDILSLDTVERIDAIARGQRNMFVSNCFSETYRTMASSFKPHSLTRGGHGNDFVCRHSWIPFPSFRIGAVSYSDDMWVEGPPPDNFFFLQFSLSGKCEVGERGNAYCVEPGLLYVLNSNEPVFQHMLAGYVQLNIWIQYDAVKYVIEQELCRTLIDPIEFVKSPIPISGKVNQLSHLINYLCSIDCGGDSITDLPVIRRQLDKAFILALVASIPNNYQEELNGGCSIPKPYYLRRAEKFICDNFRDEVSLDDIVEFSGVSQRTLHHAFRRHLGTTPLSYLKHHRLERTHEVLKTAINKEQSVTQIAFDHGFFHLSKFAADYRKRFGESPSQTRFKSLNNIDV